MEYDYDFKKTLFERVMMTGVFVGIFITVATLFYDVIYVGQTGFPYASYISVTSLIFAVNLVFLVLGPIYYGFIKLSKYGEIVFIALLIAFTVFLLLKVKGVQRTDNAKLNDEFKSLLSGIIIIVSLGAAVILPLLFHNRKFEKSVLGNKENK